MQGFTGFLYALQGWYLRSVATSTLFWGLFLIWACSIPFAACISQHHFLSFVSSPVASSICSSQFYMYFSTSFKLQLPISFPSPLKSKIKKSIRIIWLWLDVIWWECRKLSFFFFFFYSLKSKISVGKKSKIHYKNKAHINWIDSVSSTCYQYVLLHSMHKCTTLTWQYTI